MKTYDAIVIGAGQAGVPLAKRLAKAGWKVALIEKAYVGGTCVNYGCTPTKTLIASGRIAHLVNNSANWGISLSGYSVDITAIKKRKDKIVEESRNGIEKNLKEIDNLELIYGSAAFSANKRIVVTTNYGTKEEISADKIFINTGAQTTIPAIEGLETIKYLTSTTILDLDHVPDHLIIIGASYIALELGQLYRRLGSKVTIFEQSEKFLSHEDDDVAEELSKILREEGLTIHISSKITRLEQWSGAIKLSATVEGKVEETVGSHLLLAAGRSPQTDALNLSVTGVETDKEGYIKVNNKLETTAEGIYALGDVKGGPAFTHISYHDYTIVLKNLLEGKDVTTDNRMVPYCMFTDPQLGKVGISEHEALRRGINFKVAKISMENVARARETGETRGFMKAIVDTETKKILGAAVIGVEGGEIMTVLQMAMMGGVTYDQIRFGIFAHPTFSESLNNLFMTIEE